MLVLPPHLARVEHLRGNVISTPVAYDKFAAEVTDFGLIHVCSLVGALPEVRAQKCGDDGPKSQDNLTSGAISVRLN